METLENKPIPRGCKYATKEEAQKAKKRMIKERSIIRKDELRDYQREYHRKRREKIRLIEQQYQEQQEQLLAYKQQLIMYQTQVMNNNAAKTIVTPDFILEIVN
jgi:hypothetical protein